jgi:hypothetical protein
MKIAIPLYTNTQLGIFSVNDISYFVYSRFPNIYIKNPIIVIKFGATHFYYYYLFIIIIIYIINIVIIIILFFYAFKNFVFLLFYHYINIFYLFIWFCLYYMFISFFLLLELKTIWIPTMVKASYQKMCILLININTFLDF